MDGFSSSLVFDKPSFTQGEQSSGGVLVQKASSEVVFLAGNCGLYLYEGVSRGPQAHFAPDFDAEGARLASRRHPVETTRLISKGRVELCSDGPSQVTLRISIPVPVDAPPSVDIQHNRPGEDAVDVECVAYVRCDVVFQTNEKTLKHVVYSRVNVRTKLVKREIQSVLVHESSHGVCCGSGNKISVVAKSAGTLTVGRQENIEVEFDMSGSSSTAIVDILLIEQVSFKSKNGHRTGRVHILTNRPEARKRSVVTQSFEVPRTFVDTWSYDLFDVNHLFVLVVKMEGRVSSTEPVWVTTAAAPNTSK